ncbi:hypothetical protein AB0J63_45700 [Streptosporangium canum]|uniref:hypothetical protein n=1 Tax=Streptosporangium canum TaxID=324952 RepID=UPI00343A6B7A
MVTDGWLRPDVGVAAPVPAQAARLAAHPKDGPFTVIYRLYGPNPAAINGTWTFPTIQPTT